MQPMVTSNLRRTRREFLARSTCGFMGAMAWAGTLPGCLTEGVLGETPATPPNAALDAALARRVSDEAITQRKLRVLRAIAADPSFSLKRANPKYQHAIVGARLALNPKDAESLEYIRRVAAHDDKFMKKCCYARFARSDRA